MRVFGLRAFPERSTRISKIRGVTKNVRHRADPLWTRYALLVYTQPLSVTAYLIPGLTSRDPARRTGEGKKKRRDNEEEERLRQYEGERLRVIVKITGVTHCALDYFCHKVWKYNPKGCGWYMREEAGAPGEPWAPAKNEENTCKRILEDAPIY